MAGVWQGAQGMDRKPKAGGPKLQAFVGRVELQPIDPQTNGPQLLYGLRYHSHITKPDQVKTYHDQVGYWLWEPATGTVIQTLTIPRGQTAMAGGTAAADANEFEVVATLGSPPSPYGRVKSSAYGSRCPSPAHTASRPHGRDRSSPDRVW